MTFQPNRSPSLKEPPTSPSEVVVGGHTYACLPTMPSMPLTSRVVPPRPSIFQPSPQPRRRNLPLSVPSQTHRCTAITCRGVCLNERQNVHSPSPAHHGVAESHALS
ncbi:uncharacterized protein K452DRAFT_89779 [Aplosporella prunicola CBS 121167]|uniref:Uncharacterized protein n=1 Tax=Aplosporella prunicola CBS 121167 TaxID=1176127 RepID=A0A6A6B4Q7_9PEZI|nr:uncharacterized protein K452DRAFT_89779 [Aplosporella prunicola CBS 121167]KAF2138194.1 hypothetical protein K452DRAFT_89779 [Aplosporella prunicola CBS 121167]